VILHASGDIVEEQPRATLDALADASAVRQVIMM
jgi:hypothetical protein